MARRLGRLWRSGARRAQGEDAREETGEPAAGESLTGEQEAAGEPMDIGRRLEEARQRLRATIPPQEDPEGPQK